MSIQSVSTLPLSQREQEEVRKSLRWQHLRMAQIASNGFISRDLQDRCQVSAEELFSIQRAAGRLLGGGNALGGGKVTRLYFGDLVLHPGQEWRLATGSTGRKVYLSAGQQIHVTVVKDGALIFDGPFSGMKNFAQGLSGTYQITIKNIYGGDSTTTHVNIDQS